MLKSQLLHPGIIGVLAGAGHGSKVLIADGNYPFSTRRGPNQTIAHLNLAPGLIDACAALRVLLKAIPVEAAQVMDTLKSGPYAMAGDPPIWTEFATLMREAGLDLPLGRLERNAFYEAASTSDVCLTIATGETRIYANLLLTIGVVK